MNNRKTFLAFLAWSVVVLLLLSIDSPLHESYNRVDSSWFFMSGKAWMNGLTPYVDFADSKGPLLWLIYGIGYLLSPHSYTGVYVLSCLSYAVIFYYDYKIARLFFDDRRRPVMAALLMTFAYFWSWFHYEVRAEDFATLFVTISLYYLFRLLCQPEKQQPSVRRTSLVLGACFMALVLIKYSIALMQGSIILAVLYCYGRQHKSVLPPLKWLVAGAVAVALPFVCYLGTVGAWPAFVREYFVNTFLTVQPGNDNAVTATPYYLELMAAIRTPSKLALLLFIVYGAWLLSYRLPRCRFAPLFVGVSFFLVSTMHNFLYYYTACSAMLIFIVIASLALLRKPLSRWALAAVVAAVGFWGVYENASKELPLGRVAKWADNDDKAFFNAMNQVIAGCTSHHPRILNLMCFEHGFGIEQGALPVGKYWSKQTGMTVDMQREHVALLFSRQADFVIVYDEDDCNAAGFTRANISSLGYELSYSHNHLNMSNKQVTTSIYKKVK